MHQVKRKSAGQRIRFQIGNLVSSEERVWASMDILSALAADENCGPKHFGAASHPFAKDAKEWGTQI